MMVTVPSAIEELWRHFVAVRSQAGDPKAPKIVKEAAERLGIGLPEATIRGWIKQSTVHTGGGVPRNEDHFIAVITVLRLLANTQTSRPNSGPALTTLSPQEKEAWLSRLRAARTEDDADASPPPDTRHADQPRPIRTRSPATRWVAAGGAAALVVVTGLILWMSNNNDEPSRPLDIKYERGRFLTSPGPLPHAGPIVACPPATTNQPDSIAEAKGGGARAEYYRKNNLFLVYDNHGEGHSAILQLTIPGVSRTDWYNTRGHTCNGRNRPLAMVVDQIQPNQVMEYRVCTGQWDDRGRIPPERCGNTVAIDPAVR